MLKNTPSHLRLLRGVVALSVVFFLTACGGTSNIQDSSGAETVLDLQAYDSVIVGSFDDRATQNKKFKNNEKGQQKKTEYVNDVKASSGTFAEYLVAEISSTGAFSQVRRGDSAGAGELFIDGDITRYARGNAAAKFLIGMGAGSTYFDAIVRVRDGNDSQPLGQIVVDKNSWALGGVISATQSVESFMRGGAKKTAEQLSAAKMGVAASK